MTYAGTQTADNAGDTMKSYAIWNNKGGVGKTYLSFAMACEYARQNPEKRIILQICVRRLTYLKYCSAVTVLVLLTSRA
ncbi:hypothetical protein [Escherichia coli]|uniref:hypothetical protein n=1 Tax=Escherichia coli TaxID=562 RepID=UPI002022CA58|nr:hypothetical protein [Escherichia coli]